MNEDLDAITLQLQLINERLDGIMQILSNPYLKIIELPLETPYQRTLRERYEQLHLTILKGQAENGL